MLGRFRHKFKLRHRGDIDDVGFRAGLADHRAGEDLTPNLRALRLAMTVSDQLLSMGVPASSTVSRALDITDTYCNKPVHIDVISNLIMASQLRSLEDEPLTLIRPVATREVNNMTVQSIQDLVYRIRDRHLSLKEAEDELEQILKHPITYPRWLMPVANASLAAAVDLMFTTNWRIMLVTFVIVWLVDRLVFYLGRRSYATFFRQVAAGAFVTLAAAVIAHLNHAGVEFFAGMNPTIIVVGGIIMLVAGLAIVGAIQDAIDEYFLTASARILRVAMLTTGIVVGVLIGLYLARKAGMGIAVSAQPLNLTELHFQIIGGAIAAGAFAVATQVRIRAVAWAALLGGTGLAVLYTAVSFGISSVPASGLAALAVGVLAKGFSRFWRTPASGTIAAGIVPLVPGLSLYNALMQMVVYPPGSAKFVIGLGSLFTAVSIALSIAAGASFGYIMARPFSQSSTHLRNAIPFSEFMRQQLHTDRRTSWLARLALGREVSRESDQDEADENIR